ncbi:MAG: hypothetical protein PVSMB9_09910 [Candidatus Dormibacteria bacterium]
MNLIALIKERAKHYKCLACSQPLADCQVSLLNETDGHCTVEVTCASCGVNFVAVLLLKKAKHPDGLPRAAREGPISGDELLDLHQELQSFHGSLKDLVGWRRSHPQAS